MRIRAIFSSRTPHLDYDLSAARPRPAAGAQSARLKPRCIARLKAEAQTHEYHCALSAITRSSRSSAVSESPPIEAGLLKTRQIKQMLTRSLRQPGFRVVDHQSPMFIAATNAATGQPRGTRWPGCRVSNRYSTARAQVDLGIRSSRAAAICCLHRGSGANGSRIPGGRKRSTRRVSATHVESTKVPDTTRARCSSAGRRPR